MSIAVIKIMSRGAGVSAGYMIRVIRNRGVGWSPAKRWGDGVIFVELRFWLVRRVDLGSCVSIPITTRYHNSRTLQVSLLDDMFFIGTGD
jgi:hypothetical protein